MIRPLAEGLYELAARAVSAAASLVPEGGSKLQQTLHARRELRHRYHRWSSARVADRPLLWVHAPSVGEGLQARPVIEFVRRMRPDIQIAYTHFSPSAKSFAASLGVDFHEYLPFDTSRDAEWAIDALRPTALVYSKLDVWPALTRGAKARGVGLGLISATVSPGSARNRDPVRWLMRPAYRCLDLVGAVARDHAERLIGMGVRHDAIRITGDTRHDQVWARANSVDATSVLLSPLASDRPTLVAGSTWPADETVLLHAWRVVHQETPRVRLVIAPHEPSPAHLAALEQRLTALALTHTRLSHTQPSQTDVLVVDRVGVLGELYALADVAFVGGGFHAAGLHSVLEPAAFGVPVLFGPRFTNSRDAEGLVAKNAAAVATTADEMAALLRRWLSNPADRDAAGERARHVVREGLGAAQRSAEIVLELLDRGAR